MLSQVFTRRFAKFFTPTHEWIDVVGRTGVLGITSYAAHHLGDVVYVDIKVGRVVKAGEELGDLESVKATTPIMAPLGGKIIEVNPLVTKDPAIVNTSPEKDGWMAKLEIDDPTATGKLMDEPAYKKFLAKSS